MHPRHHRSLLFQLAGLTLIALLAALGPGPAARAAEAPVAPQPHDLPVYLKSPALLEVDTPYPDDGERLHALALDVIDERAGHSARVLGWPGTTETLERNGFKYRVLEPDFGRALAQASGVAPHAGEPLAPASSPPLGQGSLGGYHSLAEIYAFLDDLVASDTHGIVSSVVQIGTSRQGRAIKAIRIAKKAFPDHSRPRVLYTALHHAREPIGMQAVLEFMRRLVTLYGTDPNVTYLVDRREMWFVPVVNPDGYNINQAQYFSIGTFGLWRKNCRDNDSDGALTSYDGVDLNRNYGYRFGYDGTGSSGTITALDYRGPYAFSEPETSALRDFCIAHQFATADNYHTFGEFCLSPWGYIAQSCPDGDAFTRMSEDMMQDASYAYSYAKDLLYLTNGDANDWLYGEQVTKPKCLAVTTEVGDRNDNFWPPAARIPVLAARQVRANVVLAYTAGPYVWAEKNQIVSNDGVFHSGGSAQVLLTLRHSGLVATTGNVQVTATTSVPGMTVTDAVSTFPPLSPGTTAQPSGGDLLALKASVYVPPGTLVPLVLTITDQGNYVLRDTTTIIVGAPVVAFFDDATHGLTNWTTPPPAWGIQDPGNGDFVFSDSPNGLYVTQSVYDLNLAAPLSLAGAGHAYLTFQTTYDIEVGADAGRVQVSTNAGASWTSLPGRFTRPGHGTSGAFANGTQGLNEPVYDATQRVEAEELIDLTPYVGLTDIRLRFRLTTDDTGRREGWFIDDVKVMAFPSLSTGVPDDGPPPPRPSLTAGFPNPFRSGTRLTARFETPTVFSAAVYSVDGRLIRPLAAGLAAAGPQELYWDGTLASGERAASGAYFVRLQWDGGESSQRVVRVR